VRGVLPGLVALPGVEAVRRGDLLFVLNHSGGTVRVPVPGPAVDLLTGTKADDEVVLGPCDVVVLDLGDA
jgi:beta-galactosidase